MNAKNWERVCGMLTKQEMLEKMQEMRRMSQGMMGILRMRRMQINVRNAVRSTENPGNDMVNARNAVINSKNVETTIWSARNLRFLLHVFFACFFDPAWFISQQ